MGNRSDLGPNLLIILSILITLSVAFLLSKSDNDRAAPILPTPSLTPLLPLSSQPTRILSTNTPLPIPSTATASPIAAVTYRSSMPLPIFIDQMSCLNRPDSWNLHQNQQVTSWLQLSASSHTTISELQIGNCTTSPFLFPGQTIYYPVQKAQLPTRIPCGPPAWWVYYTVQPNDTLFSLATKRQTTVYTIKNANCLDNVFIRVDQRLFLPPPPVPTATTQPTPTLPPPTATPTAEMPTSTATILPVTETAEPTIIPSTPTSISPSPTAITSPSTATPTFPTPTSISPSPTAITSPPTATPTFPTPTSISPSPTTTTLPPTPTIPIATATSTPNAPTATSTTIPPTPTSAANTPTPTPNAPTATSTTIPPTPTDLP